MHVLSPCITDMSLSQFAYTPLKITKVECMMFSF
uniref:Uncharacterized protein n=1 Tax=Anguilla anguilla TaxID=7936 RepID=A0A0E9SMT7_ANGAN